MLKGLGLDLNRFYKVYEKIFPFYHFTTRIFACCLEWPKKIHFVSHNISLVEKELPQHFKVEYLNYFPTLPEYSMRLLATA